MAVSSVVICLEGVLQKNVSSSPIPLGIALYHGLSSTFNLLLITEEEKQAADYWLSLEALNKHAAIEYNNFLRSQMSSQDRKLDQAHSLQVRGFHVDLIIDPDPLSSVKLLNSGFNVMTFTHAQYALPRWRPDFNSSPKPWDKIFEHNIKMAELRAIDLRLQRDEEDKDALK